MTAVALAMNPCARCTLDAPGPAPCCRDWAIPIEPHEAERFSEVLVPTAAGPRYAGELRRRPSGECVFLGPRGCTIYAERPAVCRAFVVGECRIKRAAPGEGSIPSPGEVTG